MPKKTQLPKQIYTNAHIEAVWARVVRFNLLYTFIRRCCSSLFDITFFVISLPFSRALPLPRLQINSFYFCSLCTFDLKMKWDFLFRLRRCWFAWSDCMYGVWRTQRSTSELERVPFVMACVETSTSRCKRTEQSNRRLLITRKKINIDINAIVSRSYRFGQCWIQPMHAQLHTMNARYEWPNNVSNGHWAKQVRDAIHWSALRCTLCFFGFASMFSIHHNLVFFHSRLILFFSSRCSLFSIRIFFFMSAIHFCDYNSPTLHATRLWKLVKIYSLAFCEAPVFGLNSYFACATARKVW